MSHDTYNYELRFQRHGVLALVVFSSFLFSYSFSLSLLHLVAVLYARARVLNEHIF